jgi:hypothetical protein
VQLCEVNRTFELALRRKPSTSCIAAETPTGPARTTLVENGMMTGNGKGKAAVGKFVTEKKRSMAVVMAENTLADEVMESGNGESMIRYERLILAQREGK